TRPATIKVNNTPTRDKKTGELKPPDCGFSIKLPSQTIYPITVYAQQFLDLLAFMPEAARFIHDNLDEAAKHDKRLAVEKDAVAGPGGRLVPALRPLYQDG